MADKTIGELEAVNIGDLPLTPDIYDNTLLPVEQQGVAHRMTGSQFKSYAQAAAREQAEQAGTYAKEAAAAKKDAESASNIAQSASQSATTAKDDAESASETAQLASQEASDNADKAEKARQAIENLTVSAKSVAPTESAKVTKTVSDGVVSLAFDIPKGEKGERGERGPQGPAGDGSGDMLASVYDPTEQRTDVFAEIQKKQDKLTGTAGQVVGFDDSGNAAAAEVGGTNILRGTKDIKITSSGLWQNGEFAFGNQSSDVTTEIISVTDAPNPNITKGIHYKKTVSSALWSNTIQMKIPLLAGVPYTLSCYAKGDISLNLSYYDGNKWIAKYFNEHSDGWKKLTYTFVCENLSSDDIRISFAVNNTIEDPYDFYICGMKLEVGTVATDWSPAPEDLISTSGGTMTGDLTLSGEMRSIKFSSGVRTGTPIKLYKGDINGGGVVIGDGGRTMIGGGEAADNLRTELNKDGNLDSTEELHLASDNNVYIHTNCQDITRRKTVTIDGSGMIDAPGGFKGNVTGNVSGTAANVTDIVTVEHGGTGAATLASGQALIGNGAGSVQTRPITNNTSNTANLESSTNLITAHTLRSFSNRVAPAAGAETHYETLMFRGESINESEVTPAVNGAIAWQYE